MRISVLSLIGTCSLSAAAMGAPFSDRWLSLERAPGNIAAAPFLRWTPTGRAMSQVAGVPQGPSREGNGSRSVREPASIADEVGCVALKPALVALFVLLWNRKVTFLSSWKTPKKKELFDVPGLITLDTQ